MKYTLLTFLALASLVFAGGADEHTNTPWVVAKMVQGLADSKIDELTSKHYTEKGGIEYSYHLKIIDHLGTVQRDGRRYTIAAARFIRSSNKASQYPPARGHGFVLVFDDAWRVVTHGRLDYRDYHMEGDVLKSGKITVADFATRDPMIRHHGWLLDSAFMPYPFADRISDAEPESGKFRKKQ
jgi:hypothetical protein